MRRDRFQRYYITLEEEDRGYSVESKACTGYAKIQVREKKARIDTYLQDIKVLKDKAYKAYVIIPWKDIFVGILAGVIKVTKEGRGEAHIILEEIKIEDIQISMEDIKAFTVMVEEGRYVFPLVGYKEKPLPWRNKFKKLEDLLSQKTMEEQKEKLQEIIENEEIIIEEKMEVEKEQVIMEEEVEVEQGIMEEEVEVEKGIMEEEVEVEKGIMEEEVEVEKEQVILEEKVEVEKEQGIMEKETKGEKVKEKREGDLSEEKIEEERKKSSIEEKNEQILEDSSQNQWVWISQQEERIKEQRNEEEFYEEEWDESFKNEIENLIRSHYVHTQTHNRQEIYWVRLPFEKVGKYIKNYEKYEDNPYIKSACKNYSHVLLGIEIRKHKLKKFYLGIPGIYTPYEEFIYKSLGYKAFYPLAKQQEKKYCYGYWILKTQ